MNINIRKKKLIVFINRKLISYDHILPFLFELKKYQPTAKIEIWIPDFSTYLEIKKNNFLYESGRDIADFYIISSRQFKGFHRIFNTINISLKLGYRILLAVLFKITFIHYKLLDSKPFSTLKYFNKSNTFLAENDSYGFTKTMNNVTFLKVSSLEQNRQNINFLQFSDCWSQKNLKLGDFLNFGTPKKSDVWINHVKSVSEEYIRSEYKAYSTEYPSNMIPIMLGYFGGSIWQTSIDVQELLLVETLEVLKDSKSNALILLKPHMVSDLKIVHKVIKLFPELNIFITYLHPMILATQAKFVIANDYSTSLNDFKVMGVNTIEYASYNNQALKLTSGKSIRPEYVDYFINHDKLLLSETIKKLVNETKKERIEKTIEINNKNSNLIFNRMLNIG
tara:strand:+ start:304 stop:1485 length:1182 start_codon:yes stop_codon:yes gene_type:complete